jgi:hypothetical protein
MFSACLKEVLQPLSEEASIIKLWLACVAKHAKAHEKHDFVFDLPELLVPCSPVKHDSPSSVLAPLASAYAAINSLVCQDTSANTAVPVLGEMPTRTSGTDIHR